MGAVEDPLDPFLLGHVVIGARLAVGVVAENGHDRVALVEDHEPAVEVGNGDKIPLDDRRGGHPQAGDHFLQEVSIEVVVDQPPLRLVVAVADEEPGRVVARIERHPVGGVELLHPVAGDAEVLQILAALVESEDMIRGVAVGEEDVAIRGDGDRRRRPLVEIEPRFLGDAELEHDLPGDGVNLDPLAGDVAGAVQVFAFPFGVDLQIVDVGVGIAEEPADDLPVGGEAKDPQGGAGPDRAILADGDAAVGRADLRLPILAEAPAGDGVEGHLPASHPHRLLVRGSLCRHQLRRGDDEGDSDEGDEGEEGGNEAAADRHGTFPFSCAEPEEKYRSCRGRWQPPPAGLPRAGACRPERTSAPWPLRGREAS